MNKKSVVFVLSLLSMFALAGLANALDVSIDEVEVDGVELTAGSTTVVDVKKDDTLAVDIELTGLADLENVQVEAMIRGYDHDDLMEDITDVFDVSDGVTYRKQLELRLPVRADNDRYRLRVLVSDRNGETTSEDFFLKLSSMRHLVMIKDVVFTPSLEVKAGRALLTTVRLQNYGMVDEDDGIKVTVSIPELGISASDYIDELEEDEATTSEELYMRIPTCGVDEGLYDVEVLVEYDDGDELETKRESISIVESDDCEMEEEEDTQKTFITAPGAQEVVAGGSEAVYPIMVTNAGKQSRTYSMSVGGMGSWGTYRFDPAAVVVVGAGKTETVYLYATANEDAPVGENAFFVEIQSGDDKKQLPLTAVVQEGDGEDTGTGWDKVKRGLEIGLVVLVVLLVILGLIIGFQKLKGDDEEESDEEDVAGQTYY